MGFTLPSPSKTHSLLHSQRHSPESPLPLPCRNHSSFLLVLPIPCHLQVKSNRKLLTIGMQHNTHPTFDFHTFTSHPFILTMRSTFLLALHRFHSKLSSTTSPPHSPTLLPHKRPNSPLVPSTLQNSQNTPFPSTSNSITTLRSSLSPFQHPFNNHLPSAANQTTFHLTITNTLPQTHNTLLLPFPNPSLTLPPKKRKHNTRTPLPAFHHSSQFKRKQSNASLQPHDSQTVGGATLDLWLVPFVLM